MTDQPPLTTILEYLDTLDLAPDDMRNDRDLVVRVLEINQAEPEMRIIECDPWSPSPKAAERFRSRIDAISVLPCHLFTMGSKANGYPQTSCASTIRGEGLTGGAHRIQAQIQLGLRLPRTVHVDHLCKTRECVRPDHLEPVTQFENNRRQAVDNFLTGRPVWVPPRTKLEWLLTRRPSRLVLKTRGTNRETDPEAACPPDSSEDAA